MLLWAIKYRKALLCISHIEGLNRTFIFIITSIFILHLLFNFVFIYGRGWGWCIIKQWKVQTRPWIIDDGKQDHNCCEYYWMHSEVVDYIDNPASTRALKWSRKKVWVDQKNPLFYLREVWYHMSKPPVTSTTAPVMWDARSHTGLVIVFRTITKNKKMVFRTITKEKKWLGNSFQDS